MKRLHDVWITDADLSYREPTGARVCFGSDASEDTIAYFDETMAPDVEHAYQLGLMVQVEIDDKDNLLSIGW